MDTWINSLPRWLLAKMEACTAAMVLPPPVGAPQASARALQLDPSFKRVTSCIHVKDTILAVMSHDLLHSIAGSRAHCRKRLLQQLHHRRRLLRLQGRPRHAVAGSWPRRVRLKGAAIDERVGVGGQQLPER
jgi:hypothetical protein